MGLKITTWNINSVRLRIDLVEKFLAQHSPDILCLQEVKCRENEFPLSAFVGRGYVHVAINGQKGYHGVAIVSRLPFSTVSRKEFCEKGDSRHVSVTFGAGVAGTKQLTIHNFYVPAGGDEPDPVLNPKFAHKLAFLEEMKLWMKDDESHNRDAILVGDLNVAPLETDVWNHRAMLKVVSHTPAEVERFVAAQNAGLWVDALRTRVPVDQKLYTWWSYRSPNWAAADKGRRLDHVWLSQSIAPDLEEIHVLKEARAWTRPSDHVPVSVNFK
jgi:exodeoxyribonuclease III